MADRDRASVLGCPIDRLDMAATLSLCDAAIASGDAHQHMAINAAKLVACQRDERLRRIVEACDIVNADGQAVVWASRLLRDPLPERVAGIDLMHALLELSERRGYRVYFLGARPDVLARAVRQIQQAYPGLAVAGASDGYFPEDGSEQVVDRIRGARADIVFLAMSSPRKEYWLGRYGDRLGAGLVMGVGGSLDVVAGTVKRAPLWMQRAGLEWLYRLGQEPRRLWRRYLATNSCFLLLLARELARGPRRVGRGGEAGS